jgi:hypothetical protein
MVILNKYEIVMVSGGFSSGYARDPDCECQCRQHHTDDLAADAPLPKGWYRLNGELYENVVIGDADNLEQCLGFCTAMMKGNLFRACMPIKNEE